ncbi:MAG: LptF/LptG family permease [Bacteroides sp.]|nr:LptF/LptG family permease [Bacteroides sp.]MCM1447423.1 LptF/LptG family permease [Bacteroides sp.]MCM1515246.1 LptF/LptG family permease [Paraprevotella sp.]
MRIIKRLDIYILKNFLLLFAGTFFICLFIFIMQFIWQYIDDLVGKGLSWSILAEFLFYASLTLVPMSLPLAVLLASLISFGNMGEKLELLSMKAAGIPLIRILCPILTVTSLVCVASFYFQDRVQPRATRQVATLLWSMRQKSPELEIPEGIFYSDIPGYSIFVQKKNADTGMLYGVMIYSTESGYDKMEIVLADSARLQSTADQKHLKLTLHEGERFKDVDSQTGNMLQANIPYMRETFHTEEVMIPFDANFSMMDANLFNGDAQTKELSKILSGIDSLNHVSDSLGQHIRKVAKRQYLKGQLPMEHKDSAGLMARAAEQEPLDSTYARLSPDQRKTVIKSALSSAQGTQAEFEYRGMTTGNTNMTLRRHHMEARKKFTRSLACLIFFFIGAPLGAIIRKGGLGVPVVVSVLVFIFYYIVNAAGEKMAKTGEWSVWFGIWLSSMVLAPIGLFLISKANKDSVVFNIEGYQNFFKRLMGMRTRRKLNRKEIIIHDPDYPALTQRLADLMQDCNRYCSAKKLLKIPSYYAIFFKYREDHTVTGLRDRLDDIINELHNSRDAAIIGALNEMPVLYANAHTRPFDSKRNNMIAGIIFPAGIILWIRIWMFRIRLYQDLGQVQKQGAFIIKRIKNNTNNGQGNQA